MDLNEQLKGWLMQQAQPGSFIDKAGLGLAKAGQTIGQDAAAGASILNDPRNSWIGMNPVGKVVSGGLGMAGMLLGQLGPKAGGLMKSLRSYDAIQKDIDALEATLEKQGLNLSQLYDPTNKAHDILKQAGWVPEPSDLTALYKERYAVEAMEKNQFVSAVAKQTGLPDDEAAAALKALHIAPDQMTALLSRDLQDWGKRTDLNVQDLYNHFAQQKYAQQGDRLATFHWGGTADAPALVGRTGDGRHLDTDLLAKVEHVYNAVATSIGHNPITLMKKSSATGVVDDGKTLNLKGTVE
jgi:hypothetical protein